MTRILRHTQPQQCNFYQTCYKSVPMGRLAPFLDFFLVNYGNYIDITIHRSESVRAGILRHKLNSVIFTKINTLYYKNKLSLTSSRFNCGKKSYHFPMNYWPRQDSRFNLKSDQMTRILYGTVWYTLQKNITSLATNTSSHEPVKRSGYESPQCGSYRDNIISGGKRSKETDFSHEEALATDNEILKYFHIWYRDGDPILTTGHSPSLSHSLTVQQSMD